MTIKQALKYKNKLVSKINSEYHKVHTYNSIEEGQTRPYSANESLSRYFELSNELVELKTKIHQANVKVYDKIFLMSELKSRISKLQTLDCSDGKVHDRYARLNGEPSVIKNTEISVVERDNLISEIESKIEEIQEELDQYNSTTLI